MLCERKGVPDVGHATKQWNYCNERRQILSFTTSLARYSRVSPPRTHTHTYIYTHCKARDDDTRWNKRVLSLRPLQALLQVSKITPPLSTRGFLLNCSFLFTRVIRSRPFRSVFVVSLVFQDSSRFAPLLLYFVNCPSGALCIVPNFVLKFPRRSFSFSLIYSDRSFRFPLIRSMFISISLSPVRSSSIALLQTGLTCIHQLHFLSNTKWSNYSRIRTR